MLRSTQGSVRKEIKRRVQGAAHVNNERCEQENNTGSTRPPPPPLHKLTISPPQPPPPPRQNTVSSCSTSIPCIHPLHNIGNPINFHLAGVCGGGVLKDSSRDGGPPCPPTSPPVPGRTARGSGREAAATAAVPAAAAAAASECGVATGTSCPVLESATMDICTTGYHTQ